MLLILAGLAGFTAVAMGAFGAHAFRGTMAPDMFANYQTGALYHLVHAAALFGAALLARDDNAARLAIWAGLAFAVGIVFFSGSLYVLAITGQKWLGAVTPIGGVLFLAGWALIAIAGARASA
jgi:uncharacterized membrane protein YgdD (TMEM256/DUF423 family)